MSRRSEGDAMPGWSTVLRVDPADLGLTPARGPVDPAAAKDEEGEGTLHDGGEEPSPFDETTEPPIPVLAPPVAPARAAAAKSAALPPSRSPAPYPGGRAVPDPASMSGRAVAPAKGRDAPIEALSGDEFTQLDQPAPSALRELARKDAVRLRTTDDGESTTLDQPKPEALPKPSVSVQVQGVEGERIPAMIVRRAPEQRPPEPRGPDPREPRGPDPRLLENAPVSRVERKPPGSDVVSHAELTQINAAAALGIAPEPAAPVPPLAGEVSDAPADKTPPPPIARVDFGPLKLAEKEEVLARYPVETPGLSAAERLGEKVPTVRALSRVLPLLFAAAVALSFVGVFLVGPLADLFSVNQRQSAREALRTAQEREAEASAANRLPDGSIRVLTQPSKAAVEVDGYYLGRTPMMVAPPEERPRYRFRITAEGHKAWAGELRVVSGGYELEATPEDGSGGAGSVVPDGAYHRLVVTLEPR